MSRIAARGTALPETALVIGLALMLILGIAQATVIGFSQVSTDGAAFVAAHTNAIDAKTNAATAVATAFPQLNANDIVSTPASSLLRQATVSKTVNGFQLVPGVASNYQLGGGDVEFAPAGPNGTPSTFAFGVNAYLRNYCPISGPCSPTYQMYLAQYVDTQSNANGWNGPFAEWRCHQQYYASVKFPNSRPSGGLAGSIWDPNNRRGVEYPIYQWDSGAHTCK